MVKIKLDINAIAKPAPPARTYTADEVANMKRPNWPVLAELVGEPIDFMAERQKVIDKGRLEIKCIYYVSTPVMDPVRDEWIGETIIRYSKDSVDKAVDVVISELSFALYSEQCNRIKIIAGEHWRFVFSMDDVRDFLEEIGLMARSSDGNQK